MKQIFSEGFLKRHSSLRQLLVIAIILFVAKSLYANNLQVSTPWIVERDSASGTAKVLFDISWENSWRLTTAPSNWDAAYVFIKYKRINGLWYHATLSSTLSEHSTGSQGSNATITIPTGNKGALFYRSNVGTGTFSSEGVKLQWNYGNDGVTNLGIEVTEIRIFGIEMVYIPQASYYLGGGTGTENSKIFTAGTNLPYHITSESAINVGNTNGFMNYTAATNRGDGLGPIPAAFPKGFKAFYSMKYEITQKQYVDFLNTLTRAQQQSRTTVDLDSLGGRTFVMSATTMPIRRSAIRCDSIIPAAPEPITFYCDLNINFIPNEENDGVHLAANYLNWGDFAAYTDWAGLRPMTEFEFEKICRGPLSVVANGFAWGSTTITQAVSSADSLTSTETALPTNANSSFGNHAGMQGPLRVGNYARSNSNRVSSGASYYGVMDMSGNMWERCVSFGNPEGRIYTGINGDGMLDSDGNANVQFWPASNGIGSGYRGGEYISSTNAQRIADRSLGTYATSRGGNMGGRAVLTIE